MSEEELSVDAIIAQALGKLPPGGSLDTVVSQIDAIAANAAKEIGEELHKLRKWQSLAWFVSQYRGTVLSGQRPFSRIYHDSKLITDTGNLVLLGFYWAIYGLGATIAELFERQVVSSEPQSIIPKNGESKVLPPFWNILAFYPSDVASLVFSNDAKPALALQRIPKAVAICSLTFPEHWVDDLVPEDPLWSDISNLIKNPPPALLEAATLLSTQPNPTPQTRNAFLAQLGADPTFVNVRAQLKLRTRIHLSKVLWEERSGHNASTDSASQFFQHPSGAPGSPTRKEVALEQILMAIQLLSLYWKLLKDEDSPPGPLIVCIPKPGKQSTSKLQPRLGFSALHANTQPLTDILTTTGELLVPWMEALDHAGDKLLQAAHKPEHRVDNLGAELSIPQQIIDQARQRIEELQPGGKGAACLFLERILPVIAEMTRIAPGFIHEGKRFMVNVVIGRNYHEQVLGERLGGVMDFISSLCGKVPKECKQDGTVVGKIDIDFLQPLIKSSFSLFDWEGVLLFGHFNVPVTDPVRFTSLLRLPPHLRIYSPSEMLCQISEMHTGLFAINADRSGNLRIFFGGKLILFWDKRKWYSGAVRDRLEDLLCSQLTKIGIQNNELQRDKHVLAGFVETLLRISDEPHAGALFVIARNEQDVGQLSTISEPPKELWEGLKPFDVDELTGTSNDQRAEIFYRLAIMDGATAIILADAPRFADQWKQAGVRPRKLVTEQFDLNDLFERVFKNGKWADWTDCLSYGSKRASALALAMQDYLQFKKEKWPHQRLVVIAVSADGPIHFMVGGTDPVVTWPTHVK